MGSERRSAVRPHLRSRVSLVTLATLTVLLSPISAPPASAVTPFVDVALGKDHSCAIRDDVVWCWGSNDRGQLGAPTPDEESPYPVQVQALGTSPAPVALAAGAAHTCALLEDFTVRCWGANNNGQLGDGSTTDAVTPTRVALSGVESIAAGRAHTCALTPQGNDEIQSLTVTAAGGTFKLAFEGAMTTAIAWDVDASGLEAALEALPTIDDVVVRGGPGGPDGGTPFEIAFVGAQGHADVDLLATNSSELTGTGARARSAVVADGDTARVWCWGANAFGQLGTGDVVDATLPASSCLPDDASASWDTQDVECRGARIDIDPEGALWLRDADGYVRFSSGGRYLGRWARVGATDVGVAATLDPNDGQPVALVADGADDGIDILHLDGTKTDLANPAPTGVGCTPEITGVAADAEANVYASYRCGSSGIVERYAWDGTRAWTVETTTAGVPRDLAMDGSGSSPTVHVLTSVAVPTSAVSGNVVLSLAAASGNVIRRVQLRTSESACAPLGDLGNVLQVNGIGGTPLDGGFAVAAMEVQDDPDQQAPFARALAWSCVESRASAGGHVASFGDAPDDALAGAPLVADVAGTTDGDLLAYDVLHGDVQKVSPAGLVRPSWGRTLFASRPLPLLTLEDGAPLPTGVEVAAGSRSSCVPGNGGNVVCWGDNGAGQIGAGLPDHTSFPDAVTPAVTAERVALGVAHVCAAADGTHVACWGENGEGQATPPATSPTLVLVRPAAGAEFTCAIDDVAASPSAYCWGNDGEGQLGDGGGDQPLGTAVRTAAGTVTGVADIAAGTAHACGILDGVAGGTPVSGVYCWGRNDAHQVGPGAAPAVEVAQKVLFPGDPGFPSVGATLTGLDGSTTVGQWGPLLVTFDQPVSSVTASNVEIVDVAAPDTPLAVVGDPECEDDLGSSVPCANGPVATVTIVPSAPLVGGADYRAVINRARVEPYGPGVAAGWGTLQELVTGTVDVGLGSPVEVVLGATDGSTTVPLAGPLVVGFEDPAQPGSSLLLTNVNERSVTLWDVGADEPVPFAIAACVDDANAEVDCHTGPVATARLVPEQPLEPDATYLARVNARLTSTHGALIDDLASPTGLAVDGAYVYWTDPPSGTIGRARLDGTAVNSTFIEGASDPTSVVVHDDHLYWTNRTTGTIGRATLDGTDVEQSFVSGASEPMGIAVDQTYLYWTNRSANSIGRARLDGTDVETAYLKRSSTSDGSLNQPIGLAVDDDADLLYWINNGSASTQGSLYRANTDDSGSGRTLVEPGLGRPRGLDLASGFAYWAARPSDSVGRVDIPGGTSPILGFIPGAGGVQDVAVAEGFVYWTDAAAGTIGRSRLNGGGSALILGDEVPTADSNDVVAGPVADVGLALSGDDGTSLVVAPDGPFLVTFDHEVSGVDATDVVLTREGAGAGDAVGAAVLECRQDGGAVTDCDAADVRQVLLRPDETLPAGARFVAVVNPTYADPTVKSMVDLGGVPTEAVVRTATSNAVKIEGTTCPDPVCGAVSGPGGSPEIPPSGPFVVTFNQTVTNVNVTNVVVYADGDDTPIPGELRCRGLSGEVVDCATGAVLVVELVTGPLVPGQAYIVVINPPGVTDAVTSGDQELPTQPSDPIVVDGRIPDDSSVILYRWGLNLEKQAIGRRYALENATRATASYPFEGRRIQWFTTFGPRFGIASVSIDGVLQEQVNTYAPTTKYGVRRTYRGLSAGQHTLTITVLGRKGNAKATDALVAVDAFRVLTPSGWSLDPNPTPRYGWGPARFAKATDGGYMVAGYRGSAANLLFHGTSVSWHTVVGPDQGKAVVLIDQIRTRVVDLDAAKRRAKTFTFSGLSDEVHRFRIAVVKPPRGRGTLVAIDGFTVGGPTP